MFGLGLPEIFVLFFCFGLPLTVFWVWSLVDCAMNESSTGNDKVVWIVIILFTHCLGASIYFFVRRPNRIAELGR